MLVAHFHTEGAAGSKQADTASKIHIQGIWPVYFQMHPVQGTDLVSTFFFQLLFWAISETNHLTGGRSLVCVACVILGICATVEANKAVNMKRCQIHRRMLIWLNTLTLMTISEVCKQL